MRLNSQKMVLGIIFAKQLCGFAKTAQRYLTGLICLNNAIWEIFLFLQKFIWYLSIKKKLKFLEQIYAIDHF